MEWIQFSKAANFHKKQNKDLKKVRWLYFYTKFNSTLGKQFAKMFY